MLQQTIRQLSRSNNKLLFDRYFSSTGTLFPLHSPCTSNARSKSRLIWSRSFCNMSDDNLNYKYVVVGAGNAAGYAARQFIQNGVSKGEVCIIGDEPVVPYERPALSKAVLVNEKVRLPVFHTCVGGGGDRQPPEWYEQNGIDTMLSCSVKKLDVNEKRVELEDGRAVVASEAVIVATGASAIRLSRNPGHDLNGIYYLRNNEDALALYDALQANIGKSVVIIGGGYIGMEVAAAAVNVGCEVTMIFPEKHLMERLFTTEIAALYEQLYHDKGVTFVKDGAMAKEFIADNSGSSVAGVVVMRKDDHDQVVSASLVVVGVGARPETSLLKDQVDMDDRGGVIVNSSLQTSADNVYAIGDIASFPLKMYDDKQTRMEHVQNARETAAHVVNAIVKGDTNPYDYLPYFYSRIFHMSWQFFGDNSGDCHLVVGIDGSVLVDWSESKGSHPQMLAAWLSSDGVVQGIFMESPSTEDTANMKKVVRERPTVDVEQLKSCSSVQDVWKLLL